jgi:hypothetical protein
VKRRRIIVGLLALGFGALIVAAARADIAPLPGEQEAMLANLIEHAGYKCPKVASFEYATGARAEPYANSGLDPYIARCVNSKAYLVGVPPRRRPGPNSSPQPEPRVKEVTD